MSLEPEELLVEEAVGGSSVPLLTETGMTAGARVLFNGAEEKEDTGRKNGTAVLFDLIASWCWIGEIPFTPVTLML